MRTLTFEFWIGRCCVQEHGTQLGLGSSTKACSIRSIRRRVDVCTTSFWMERTVKFWMERGFWTERSFWKERDCRMERSFWKKRDCRMERSFWEERDCRMERCFWKERERDTQMEGIRRISMRNCWSVVTMMVMHCQVFSAVQPNVSPPPVQKQGKKEEGNKGEDTKHNSNSNGDSWCPSGQ